MVSRFEQIDYIKYDTYLFVNLVLVLTRKAVLFALDLSVGFASLTSSLGSSANKISYFVRTRLNWNKQIRIIRFHHEHNFFKKLPFFLKELNLH
jgi:hypothetical protein